MPLLVYCSNTIILNSVFFCAQGDHRIEEEGCLCLGSHKEEKMLAKYVDKDKIKKHMESKEVGDVDAWAGDLNIAKIQFCIYICEQLRKYTIKLGNRNETRI